MMDAVGSAYYVAPEVWTEERIGRDGGYSYLSG